MIEREDRLALAEPIAWRIRVREGHATFYIYTERLPFEPDADSQIVVLGEPEPLYAALRLSPVMEGMPSIEQLRVAIADGFNNGNQQYEDCDAFMRMRFDAAARAVAALSEPHPQARGEDVDLSNHHNALKCPYCNPDGLVLARPSEATAGRQKS